MKLTLILLFPFLIFSCKDKIEEQTIFSSESVKQKFSKKLLGKSKKEIYETLGEPFKEEKMVDFEAFLYTKSKNNYEFYEGFDFVNSTDNNEKKSDYILFSFKNDTVKNILENEKFVKKNLIGKSKKEIIELYGNPTKKIKCDKTYTILTFTNRRSGDIDKKMPKYYFKNIVLNEKNIAIKVIDTINNDLNINKFACEE